jgi:hypothetical protein
MDHGKWNSWFEKNRDRLEKGAAGRKGEGGEKNAPEKTPLKAVSFYGIPTPSKRIVFILDASRILVTPVDLDIARKHSIWYWIDLSITQREGFRTQHEVLDEEMKKTLDMMEPGILFNILLLHMEDRRTACWPKMMAATPANKEKARAFVKTVKPRGWAPQVGGIFEAYRIGGLDPASFGFEADPADTFFLVNDGELGGGRYMTVKTAIGAVKRANRFRNVDIHTIRIGDLGPEAGEFLEGLAKATGGKHVWRKK